MSGRRRSSSVGAELTSTASAMAGPAASAASVKAPKPQALQATQDLWELVCDFALQDPRTQQSLLHSTNNVTLFKLLLDRAHQLDYYSSSSLAGPTTTCANSSSHEGYYWLSRLLRQADGESGYTPFHWAVLKARLPVLLLLLRYTVCLSDKNTNITTSHSHSSDGYTPAMSYYRSMMHRPLALLQGELPSNLGEPVRAVLEAVDKEGLTAFQLLERLQVPELQKCRKSFIFSPLHGGTLPTAAAAARRPRQNSFDAMLQEDHEAQVAQQNEFAELHQYMQNEQHRTSENAHMAGLFTHNTAGGSGGAGAASYACEVLAFGRPNHLALGVQGGRNFQDRTTPVASSSSSEAASASSATTTTTFRPHRVQTFAQDRVGREGSAVAVAAAAHHTLVATRQGHLYAFGVGTGGRLGTGDNERHCPAPTRVLGALTNRRVVAIAAAENHSLCVTSDGAVYAFGSNRFGQLGYNSTSENSSSNNNGHGSDQTGSTASRCCLPKRVDDLWKKRILCISVAAGEKHSVALSQKGEVYVWGGNASGQLGVNHRSISNSGMAYRVQRVDALWNDERRKVCFQIAASSHATMVLAKPNAAGGLPVNQVYAWGHGNHVPSRVHFSDLQDHDSQRQARADNGVFMAATGRHAINPVAIACARYHNAAITADGRVYTFGLHAEPLGGQTPSSKLGTAKSSKNCCQRPQLVTGMLPEEGGGFAVAVSASENHTAVVTDQGSLFTWGASYGKGVLGHEGVRWQPCPKRVSGVSRAVGVSAAKEHTILLMGATFPPTADDACSSSHSTVPSLERLAAQQVAKYVDLFNVLPILLTAERTNCHYLVDYCNEFIRLNLDGVLNVSQKSTLDLYLKEQIASGLLLLDEDPRDRRERALILDVALAAKDERKASHESETVPSDALEWMESCAKMARKDATKQLLYRTKRDRTAEALHSNAKCSRPRSSSSVGSSSEAFNENRARPRSSSVSSDALNDHKMSSSERCIMLTTNMDLSTRELVQAKYDCLTREIRGLKKRLNQISKLEILQAEDNPDNEDHLSTEQKEKVARRPQLESELCIFEPALQRVEKRMLQFNLRLRKMSSSGTDEAKGAQESDEAIKAKSTSEEKVPASNPAFESDEAVAEPSFRCTTCNIMCPDDTSYALHLNGRKHRNRVAQEAEEEEKRAAAQMMEERHRQQMEEMMKSTGVRKLEGAKVSVWSKSKNQLSDAVQPKYKLPPPPNSAQEIVEQKPKSFLDIMAEEQRKVASQQNPGAKSRPRYFSASLQLPPGSAPALKSPPWAVKQGTTVASAKAPQTPPLKKAPESPWSSASPKVATAVQLQKNIVPQIKSPSWAVKPEHASVTNISSLPVLPAMTSSQAPRASSFRDFLQRAPTTPLKSPKATTSSPWSSPPLSKSSNLTVESRSAQNASPAPFAAMSFQDIQKQEEEFKNIQDQSYKDNSKWFIERRERAGSFAAIQKAATKQREEQLFIEEQKRIEEQIQLELATQKRKEERKKRQKEAKKARQNASKKKNEIKNSEEQQQQPTEQGQQQQTSVRNKEPAQGVKGPLAGNRNKSSGNNRRQRSSKTTTGKRESGPCMADSNEVTSKNVIPGACAP